jgi:hypothetical protein
LKPFSLSLPTAAALFTAAFFAVAQSPAPPAGSPPPAHEHGHPAPTNLKVLPKNLTGDRVHEIMHQWEADLGVHCRTCHVEDPKDIGPNGRPRFNYAVDSKPEKASARIMYAMVEDINSNYVAKIEDSGMPVTCGTCHQGHLNPEPFSADEPRPSQGGQPAGEKPPAPK